MSYYDDAPSPSLLLLSSTTSTSGGGGKPSHSNKTQHSTVSSSSSSSSSLLKQQTVLRRKFAECVQDWIHIDDQLQQVMDSIAHLRDRLLSSSRWIQQQQRRQEQQPEKHGALLLPGLSGDETKTKKPDHSWKSFGFRHQNCGSSGIVVLEVQDFELALSHELLQHERMLSLARTLLFSLSTTLDTMSRRFEEWMVWELDIATVVATAAASSTSTTTRHDESSASAFASSNHSLGVTDAQHAYLYLGQDLYRKQGLVQQVLDTARQEDLILVQREQDETENGTSRNDMIGLASVFEEHPPPLRDGGRRLGTPTKVARSSAQEWKLFRHTRKEEWQVVDRFGALVLPSSGG